VFLHAYSFMERTSRCTCTCRELGPLAVTESPLGVSPGERFPADNYGTDDELVGQRK
jgi:hypothetical protein